MEVLAAIGAGAVGVWGGTQWLFGHNMGLWQFDKGMRQNAVYFAQENAVSLVGLWREDMDDLFAITNTKMDNFTMVSTFVMGFALGMVVDYPMEANCPTWLFIAGQCHIAACFSYSVLSMIFSMYAGIYVQQFQTKTMTEVLRPPIADAKAIEAGSANARQYENVSNARTMLRIPVISRMLPKDAKNKKEELATFQTSSPHMGMFQAMESVYMPLANYARVSMICSLVSINYALIYLFIDEHLVTGLNFHGTFATVLIMATLGLLLQRLDFIVPANQMWAMWLMHWFPPVLAVMAQSGAILHSPVWTKVAAPVIFFLYACWCLVLIDAANESYGSDLIPWFTSTFRLTKLHEMQFGPPTQEQESHDVADADNSKGGEEVGGAGASFASVTSDLSAPLPDLNDTSGLDRFAQQNILRDEVKGYQRAANAYLAYLMQQTRGNFAAYEQELKALCTWANEAQPSRDTALPLDQLGTPTTCAVGHGLQMKQGQTVFHVTGRFCAACLRDLDRKELRYTCPRCTKYDVCEQCSTSSEHDRRAQIMFGRATRDTQGKFEKLLDNALQDMRRRIPQLDDCKDRTKAPRRRGTWRSNHHQRQSDDAPLEDELVEMLADPIRQDKLKECLGADACQHMNAVPWRIFNMLTAAICFCWTVAFVWSVVDAVTGDDMGKPHPSMLTPEWNELYNPDTVGWPDRRLAPSTTDSAVEVSMWLRHLGYIDAARKSLAFEVNGRHIRFFDDEAWRELGVHSRLDQASLTSLLESQ